MSLKHRRGGQRTAEAGLLAPSIPSTACPYNKRKATIHPNGAALPVNSTLTVKATGSGLTRPDPMASRGRWVRKNKTAWTSLGGQEKGRKGTREP